MKYLLVGVSIVKLIIYVLIGVTSVFSEAVGFGIISSALLSSVAAMFCFVLVSKMNSGSAVTAWGFLSGFFSVLLLDHWVRKGEDYSQFDANFFWLFLVISGVLTSLLLFYEGVKYGRY